MNQIQSEKKPVRKELDLDQIIRTETVLSRLPMHNLERYQDQDDFRIMIRKAKNEKLIEAEKTAATRAVEEAKRLGTKLPKANKQNTKLKQFHTYWKVSPSAAYGWPGQLSYDFETLFLSKLLDEAERPLARVHRIGPLSEIKRALGRKGRETALIKHAILQSVHTGIDFRVNVPVAKGKELPIEGHGTRFNLIARGEKLPTGGRAETFYISFNDPFLHIYDSYKETPKDYKYLSSLKPLERRFYELLGPSLWGVYMRGEAYLEVAYSWYCVYAPVRRHKDRKLMQTQMGRIQRIHIQSNYIEKVEYVPTTDAEGKDWLIRYYPGKAATEEHRVFNGLEPRKRFKSRKKPSRQVDDQKPAKQLSQAKIRPNSEASDALPRVLARYLELFPQAKRTRKADGLALELVEDHCHGDEELAIYVIEQFARATEETGWREKVQTFEALFSQDGRYVKAALEQHHEQRQQQDAKRNHEQEQRRQAEELAKLEQEAEYYWGNLDEEEKTNLIDDAEEYIRGNSGWMKYYSRKPKDESDAEIRNTATIHARDRVKKNLREQRRLFPEL